MKLYMCGVDYQHHLPVGGDPKGAQVYPTFEALKNDRPCWRDCGVVVLGVSKIDWAVEQRDYESTESRVDKAKRRGQLRCAFCRPNRNENAKRRPKPDRKKNPRRMK